ncbi:hypothetical protein QJS04_geneDACA005992 [Acorus gramineus]|uniref:KIB1-4 beta-propeller domain-containing protein n=1 Tax=Acorus gramineus TaxID=55184 RepID=A0AAV9B7T4_ACOGR|nr:hypothetical protein QJS04_geneDACA005992 [Acorus gramineus]
MVDDNLDLYLFNPFSTAVVPLPPFRNDFISEPIPRPYGSLVYFVWKAVWFAEPTDPNCIIALLYQWDYTRDMETGVVYYKWGDARWTVLETSLESVDNVVFFNENLYLVDRWGGVKEIDLHQGREITMETWLKGYKYLGAGPSGPLLVAKHMKACEVRPFELFELDRTLKKWVETKSLDEGMFFLGMNTLIWLSSSNLKGCKGNSIYFIYYNMNDRRKDLCIFNLEDGSFGTICGIDEKLLYNGYEWVVPIP